MKVQRGERKTSKKAHPCIVWHCAEREGGRRRFYGRVATAEIPRQNANCALFPIFFWLGVDGSQKPALFSARRLHSGSTQHHLLGRPCCYCMRGGTKREREKETRVHRRTTPSAAAAVGLPSSSFPPPSNQRTHYGKRMGKREKLPGFSEKGKYPKHPPTTRHLRNCQAGLGWKYKSPIQVDHKKIVFRQN